MSKKLLQLNVTANVGSTGRIAEEIGRTVMAHGWESYIAYGRDAANSSSSLIRVGDKKSILYHALSTRLFDNIGLLSKNATRKLITQIEDIDPSVIHLHNIHGYWINYPILFDYLSSIDIPIVWTLHDCWPFTGHCAYFIDIGCEKWKTGCHSCELQKAFPTSYVLDKSERNFRLKSKYFTSLGDRLTIIPVSNWLSGLVGESFLQSSARKVIYNGVDTRVFKPCDIREEKWDKFGNKKLLLGVASGWDERKGLDDFIKLSKCLPENYHIVLVGLTKKQIDNLPCNISGFKQTASIEELIRFYNMADVVLSLSKAETFGLTIAESMACGTPAIVYDVTAMPELINDSVGLTVPLGDVGAAADAVIEICSRNRASLSKLCRQYVVENFDSYLNYEKYYQVYKSVIK